MPDGGSHSDVKLQTGLVSPRTLRLNDQVGPDRRIFRTKSATSVRYGGRAGANQAEAKRRNRRAARDESQAAAAGRLAINASRLKAPAP